VAEIEEGADVRNVKSAIDDETYRHELMRDFKLPTVKASAAMLPSPPHDSVQVACVIC
jgi:hypothetical protein